MKEMNKALKKISTKELNCELEKRKGVKVFRVKPYQRYKITIDDKFIDDIGPVIITLNID